MSPPNKQEQVWWSDPTIRRLANLKRLQWHAQEHLASVEMAMGLCVACSVLLLYTNNWGWLFLNALADAWLFRLAMKK